MAHFREELRQIPDLQARARRLVEIEIEVDAELRQIKLRLARDMAAQGLSMRQIGEAFNVSRARAHQLVHQRSKARSRGVSDGR